MDGLFSAVSLLGETVLSALKKAGGIIGKPFVLLFRFLLFLFTKLFRLTVGLFAPDGMNGREYAGQVSRRIRRAFRDPAWAKRALGSSLRSYRLTPRKAVLWLVPVVSAAVLIAVSGQLSSLNTALCVTANGEVIGYARSESDFLTARENAEKRLSLGGGSAEQLLPDMTYKVCFVGINDYTDAEALTDNILLNSGAGLTGACGVYIDGEFFCAVKNEEDAAAVFAEDLAAQKRDGEIVSYTENITYSHGLYPDNENCIWTEHKLRRNIGELRGSEEYYTAHEGEDKKTVCENTGLTKRSLSALNPWFTDDMVLSEGAKVLISEEGEFLTVKKVRTVVSDVVVPYETIEIDTDTLYEGTMRVLSEGEKGVDQVTSLATYINGEKTETKEIYRLTVKEPTVRRLQVGTRKQKGSGYISPAVAIPVAYLGGQMVWPVSGAYNINSDYGYRWGKLHAGLDIGMGSAPGTSMGKPVVAAADGVVVLATTQAGYGYCIKIDHGGGVQTMYGHLYANSFTVVPGQTVKQGQQIARVGSTGNSTGPHLHFEVRVNGRNVDPKIYLGLN